MDGKHARFRSKSNAKPLLLSLSLNLPNNQSCKSHSINKNNKSRYAHRNVPCLKTLFKSHTRKVRGTRIHALIIRTTRQRRNDARRQPLFIAPLHRALRVPGPVEPAPAAVLEGVHLRLGQVAQVLRVAADVVAGVGVGGVACAGGVLERARGRCHGRGRVGGGFGERAGPARARADVVEERGAVGVGLGEFAGEDRAPTLRERVSRWKWKGEIGRELGVWGRRGQRGSGRGRHTQWTWIRKLEASTSTHYKQD